MPESTETDIPVSLDKESLRNYKSMILKTNEDVDFSTAGVASMKAYQVCSGFYFLNDHSFKSFPTAKMDALNEIVDSTDRKIVVFALFIPSIDRICENFTKKGIRFVKFDSSVKEAVWQDFQSDPGIRVFVTQYQKGSEGIDLFAADMMVFFEPTPSAYNLEQAKARIMRKGQVNHCNYYYLYADDTIEEKRMRSVRSGIDESRRLADQWAEEERQKYLKNEK